MTPTRDPVDVANIKMLVLTICVLLIGDLIRYSPWVTLDFVLVVSYLAVVVLWFLAIVDLVRTILR